MAAGANDGLVEAVVDGHQLHPRRLIGDGVVFTTAKNDAFRDAITVSVALSSASIGAENVLPRFVVHDEPIQPARDDFAIAEAGTVLPTSFAMPMKRPQFESKYVSPQPRNSGQVLVYEACFVNHFCWFTLF